MARRTPRADLISRTGVALADDFGTVYRLDKLDSVSVRAVSNPARVRFGVEMPGGGVDWRGDDVPIQVGGWTDLTDGLMDSFSYFQLANLTSGSTATVDLFAVCKGI
jgi:hypothetical protein